MAVKTRNCCNFLQEFAPNLLHKSETHNQQEYYKLYFQDWQLKFKKKRLLRRDLPHKEKEAAMPLSLLLKINVHASSRCLCKLPVVISMRSELR